MVSSPPTLLNLSIVLGLNSLIIDASSNLCCPTMTCPTLATLRAGLPRHHHLPLQLAPPAVNDPTPSRSGDILESDDDNLGADTTDNDKGLGGEGAMKGLGPNMMQRTVRLKGWREPIDEGAGTNDQELDWNINANRELNNEGPRLRRMGPN